MHELSNEVASSAVNLNTIESTLFYSIFGSLAVQPDEFLNLCFRMSVRSGDTLGVVKMQRTGGGQSAGLGLAFKRDVGNTNVLGTLFLKDSRVCGASESPELGVDERILIVNGIRDL